MRRLSKALFCLAVALILSLGAALTVNAASEHDTIRPNATWTGSWGADVDCKYAYLTVEETGYYDILVEDLYGTAYLSFSLYDLNLKELEDDVWYDTYAGTYGTKGPLSYKNVYLIAGHLYEVSFRYGEWLDNYYNKPAYISVSVNKTTYEPLKIALGQYTSLTLGNNVPQRLEFRTTTAADYIFEANQSACWEYDLYEKSSGLWVGYDYELDTVRYRLKANTDYIICTKDDESSTKIIRFKVSAATKNINSITVNAHNPILPSDGYFYEDSATTYNSAKESAVYNVTYSDKTTELLSYDALYNSGIYITDLEYAGECYSYDEESFFKPGLQPFDVVYMNGLRTHSTLYITSYVEWINNNDTHAITDFDKIVIEYKDEYEYTHYWKLQPAQTNNYVFCSPNWSQINKDITIFDKNSNVVPYTDGYNLIAGEQYAFRLTFSYKDHCNDNVEFWFEPNRDHVHQYSSICDASCDLCGNIRTVSSHEYTNDSDSTCNICGAVSAYPGGNTLTYENGKWYHIVNRQKVSDTTLVYWNSKWWYVKDGVVNQSNTLCNWNGKWYHVKDGTVVYDTTLVNFAGNWYYVKNGIVDFNATTLCYFGSNWYYVKGGQVNYSNTLCNWNGKWYHVKNGKVVYDTTLVNYGGYWFYVKGGIVDFNATTLCYFGGNWYYVKGGQVNYSNSLYKWNNKWYHVKNGTVVYDTTLVSYGGSWFYVKDGVVDFSATTLCYYGGYWFYVKSGVVDFNATTLCYFGGKWYYVKAGQVNYSNSLCSWNGKWYHVKNGTVVYDTTLVYFSGNWYYVKNGIVDFTYSSSVLFAGSYYTVYKGVKV